MASTVSLAVLVAAIRRRADNQRRTDAEIGLEANRSAKALDGMITKKWSCLYRFTQTDLTTTAAQAYVAAPADFKDLIKIGWVNGSDPIRLDKMGIENEWVPTTSGSWHWGTVVPRYDVRGQNIWLAPTPTTVETLRLQYVPVLPTIEDSTPTPLDAFNGWEDWVINDVAAKLLAEEETDNTMVSQLRDRAGARIKEEASTRDLGNAPTVQRVRYRRAWRGRP